MALKAVSTVSPLTTIGLFNNGVSFNILGDSIGSGGDIYQPYGAGLNTTYNYQGVLTAPVSPQWLANTPYLQYNTVQNNGLLYYASVAGTSGSSGGPVGTGGTDGTVTWVIAQPQNKKSALSGMFWAEIFSQGKLIFDQSQGYGGLYGALKLIVVNPGNAYASADTINIGNGAKGTLTLNGSGGVTGVIITDSGFNVTNTSYNPVITTSTGSGATFSVVWQGTGTFSVSGCTTNDMVARLPDVVASSCHIIVVQPSTNDVEAGIGYSTIIANMRNCYETLLNAGKKVIATTSKARDDAGMTSARQKIMYRVDEWIRSYVNGAQFANPNSYVGIALADSKGYIVDGTNPNNYPTGGTGAQRSMTYDGVHFSPRGAWYEGYVIWQAATTLMNGATPYYNSRSYSQGDGYDPTYNPSGNLYEGAGWSPTTGYALGAIAYNDTAPIKIYVATTAGTSASSGGPTGTSGTITDGSVVWKYVGPAGISVFNSGTAGSYATVGSVTVSGSYATGMNFARNSGSAAGTIVFGIETPWSNGQIGQRQTIAISVGSGTNKELYNFYANYQRPLLNLGIQSLDLGSSAYYVEAEIEVSGLANVNTLYLYMQGSACFAQAGYSTNGTNYGFPNSAGEMLVYPNNGKILLRTQPMVLPLTETYLYAGLQVGFDASGGAGSATATIKWNYLALKKAYIS